MSPKQTKAAGEASLEARHRATAVRHAQVIQQQKDLHNQVLDTIIEFIDLPSTSTADPARPSTKDSTQVKQGLSIFQKRDFDELVTERNISTECGYVLCPEKVTKDVHGPTDRIIWSKKGGSDLKIVPRADLEKWCSRACGARAAFLRAQLSDSPVWVNGPLKDEIILLEEAEERKNTQRPAVDQLSQTTRKQEKKVDGLVDGIRQLALRDSLSAEDEEALRRLQELALERGKVLRGEKIGDVSLVEKKNTKPPQAPEPGDVGSAGTIDGYQPNLRLRLQDDDDDVQDILDL